MHRTFSLLLAAVTFCAVFPLRAVDLTGDLGSHDPSRIIECHGKYYVYSTGGSMKWSSDLIHWTRGTSPFPNKVPDSLTKLLPQNRGIWAPDIIFHNDLYYLYYSVASSDGAQCATGLLTSPTLDPEAPNYAWKDVGLIITEQNHVAHRSPIDPAPIVDQEGKFWLCFGSGYANGTKPDGPTIFLVQLDPATGLLLKPVDPVLYPLAPGHIEAGYVHFHAGYYYVFWNSGGCCNGAKSTYEIHVARSAAITGPYVGKSSTRGGDSFYKSHDAVHGPGHMGILTLRDKEIFTYHYYPDTGRSQVGMEMLTWDADGWPVPGPDPAPGTTLAAMN